LKIEELDGWTERASHAHQAFFGKPLAACQPNGSKLWAMLGEEDEARVTDKLAPCNLNPLK
jgi:hypothetical protein